MHYVGRRARQSSTKDFPQATAAPTTGKHFVGDRVRNNTPAEAGSASSKYVIDGWVCTVAGVPGTWLEQRTLTGN